MSISMPFNGPVRVTVVPVASWRTSQPIRPNTRQNAASPCSD